MKNILKVCVPLTLAGVSVAVSSAMYLYKEQISNNQYVIINTILLIVTVISAIAITIACVKQPCKKEVNSKQSVSQNS